MALDAERLRAHQSDLLTGEPAIRDEMARLEAVRDVCRSVSSRVRSIVEDAERNMAELKRKGDPDVDELVCSTTIVHNQYVTVPGLVHSVVSNFCVCVPFPRRAAAVPDDRLINLVAEDNAIEDTIYHLHRALNAGRIDLERFLRVRHVCLLLTKGPARARAAADILIIKPRQPAPWPRSSS
jgi:ESCRT-I complex subunit TSG101